MIAVGCCGRAGLSLAEYARRFRAMEVQETFYRILGTDTLARWRSILGEGFRLTMKAFQGVSHPTSSPTWRRYRGKPEGKPEGYGLLRDTREVASSWDHTVAMARAMRAEYVIVQMPPSFGPTDENIRRIAEFFRPRRGEFGIGLEVRGEGWSSRSGELRGALEAAGVTHVTDPLVWPPVHVEGAAYFRLHGRLPRYDYQYRSEELLRLAEIVKGYRDAYVFFNNLAMAEDASRFMAILEGGDYRLPGPRERAKMIASRFRGPMDPRTIVRRFGYLRVGVEGEPTVGELLRDAKGPLSEAELEKALSRRSDGISPGRSSRP